MGNSSSSSELIITPVQETAPIINTLSPSPNDGLKGSFLRCFPREMLGDIAKHLDIEDLLSLSCVCRELYNIANSNQSWMNAICAHITLERRRVIIEQNKDDPFALKKEYFRVLLQWIDWMKNISLDVALRNQSTDFFVVVEGAPRSGKTTFVSQFPVAPTNTLCSNPLYVSRTVGYRNKKISITVAEDANLHHNYVRDICLVLLFDWTDVKSLSYIKKFLKKVKHDAPYKKSIVVVGNKADKPHAFELSQVQETLDNSWFSSSTIKLLPRVSALHNRNVFAAIRYGIQNMMDGKFSR